MPGTHQKVLLMDAQGNPFNATPAGGFQVSAPIVLSAVGVTRPANVTPYAAGQCWGTASSCVFSFPNVAAAGGKGRVVSARMAKSTGNITNASFRLWLHSTATLATQPAADQAPLNLAFTNRVVRFGIITFNTFTAMAGAGADGFGVLSADSLPFDLAGAETALTGFLEVLAAYTPGSSETAYIELGIAPNE